MQPIDPEQRLALAHAVMYLLDNWQVEGEDQVRLLGLPSATPPRRLQQYRQDMPLPDDSAVLERAEHLVGIDEALRTTFPHNAKMGTLWLKQKNRQLGGRKPLLTMLEDGVPGLVAVRCNLDCAYAWHLDEVRYSRMRNSE